MQNYKRNSLRHSFLDMVSNMREFFWFLGIILLSLTLVLSGCSLAEPIESNEFDIGIGLDLRTPQHINYQTWVAIEWTDERYDDYNMWSSGSKIYIVEDGTYLITAYVRWASDNNGFRGLLLRENGDNILSVLTHPVQSGETRHIITKIVKFTKGDYVELFAYQNAVNPYLDIVITGLYPTIEIQRIGWGG